MDTKSITSNGAKFVKADLHIHSFGEEDGSYDVKDTSMTPENIVDQSLQLGLSIIAITDHNEITNSKKAIDYSTDKPITVIPGIEVSTTQGHLLLYFNTFSDLRKFHGGLDISEDKKLCHQGMVECLNRAEKNNGFGVLAHIDIDSGFERTIGRFDPKIEEIFCHENLYGLEITKIESIKNYTDSDEDSNRKALVAKRRSKLDENSDRCLPKLMGSDAHDIGRLGRNIAGNHRLTRVKLSTPDYHGLKIALMSHESRIRIEDEIPESIPQFTSIKFEGGLLAGQEIAFSNNLTCIIGGRGTGKSTIIQSLLETSGNGSEESIVDSEVWSEKISISYKDEVGRDLELVREKSGEVYNAHDPVNGITKIQIESYGQGKTAETIQHSDKDPSVLVDLLDKFVNVEHLKSEDGNLKEKLRSNQSALNKLRLEVSVIPEVKKLLKYYNDQIEKLKKEKVGELVEKQIALIKEKTVRTEVVEELKSLKDKYQDILSDKSIFSQFEDLTDDDIIIGKGHFQNVKKLIKEFSEIVSNQAGELNKSLESKLEKLRAEVMTWASKEKDLQKQIDDKKKELSNQKIPVDQGQINQLLRDQADTDKKLKSLSEKQKELKEFEKERKDLVIRRKANKDAIYFHRMEFARKVNENLKAALDGFRVSIKYDQGLYSPFFEEQIKTTMDYRTSSVPKASLIAENITPLDFVTGVKMKNLDSLKAVLDQNGQKVFKQVEIDQIVNKFHENYAYESVEAISFEDRPRIMVSKRITDSDGIQKTQTKSISKLSLGQQQSILLAILMQSESRTPLIIDQPEDNLDSEFIYKTIVSTLRKIKEKRQVIIVTHNPNIAVLGDAELILPLKSSSTKSLIIDRGSIDSEKVRALSCEILEGGSVAFRRRKEIYRLN